MDGKIGRNGTIDLIQEFAELDGAMAWPAFADLVMPVRGCQRRAMVRKVASRLIRLPASLEEEEFATCER